MDYKRLSKYDKLAEIQQLNFCKGERHNVAVYLNALRTNNLELVSYYEQFGNTPHKFLMNFQSYERGLLFGFTDIIFNDYGWLDNESFQEKERFEFKHKEGWPVSNYIQIGKGRNDKWTYGASYSTTTSGQGYGMNVWGKIFETRDSCLKAGLQEILDWHKKYYHIKYSPPVVRQVKRLYSSIPFSFRPIDFSFPSEIEKVVQLSLF